MNLTDLKHRAIAQWRQTGPVTRALCLTMLGLNLLLSWLPATLGGEALITPRTVPGARLPALVLDGLVVVGGGFMGLLLTLAIVAWLNQARLRQLWQRDPQRVIMPAAAVLAVAAVLHLLVMPGRGAAVALDVLLVGFLARGIEKQLTSRRLFRVLALVLAASGLVTAVVLWLWAGSYQALLTGHYGMPNGTRALFHALVVVWALPYARQTLHPLPITGLHVVWFLTALAVFDLLFSGFAEGLRTLTAILVARALIEGGWHPRTWRGRLGGVWRETRRGWQRIRALADRGRGPTVH